MASRNYLLQQIIHSPSPISSLSVRADGYIFAGSDDGSLRVYQAHSSKVLKAIRGFRQDISCVVSCKPKGLNIGDVWLASGQQAALFQLDTEKLVLQATDAVVTLHLCENDEDILNELTLDSKENFLAFSCDSGSMGVVDLSSRKVMPLKIKHSNICGTVCFVPDRPGEIVSGGFDSALLHTDYKQGKLLSRYDLTSLPATSGISVSPFILSTSISTTGVLASSTADGRLFIGAGGEKVTSQNRKRTRMWRGLKEDQGITSKIAEGPVVAVCWVNPIELIACTLLGTISRHNFQRSQADTVRIDMIKTWTVKQIVKVNAMVAQGNWLVIGGFDKNGKGLIEVWYGDMQS